MFVTVAQFDGINNITTPVQLPSNIAQNFVNVDTCSLTLKSAKTSSQTATAVALDYYYKRPGFTKESDTPLSIEYLNGYLYYTSKGQDATSVLKRVHSGGTEYTVGISSPSNTLTLAQSGGYYKAADFYYAYFYYAITFYEPETGEESEPLLSDVIQMNEITCDISLDVSDIEADDIATHVNIYRVGGMNDKFLLVDSVDISGLSTVQKQNWSYADDKQDTALTKLLTTRGTISPPTGLCNLTYHNGRFYASIGSRLRFSPFGNANRWDANSYLDFESDIVALASVNGVLMIFLESKTFVLAGSDIYDYRLLTLTGDIGCADSNSVAYFRNTVIWYTYNGLVASDGSMVQYLTKQVYDFPDGMTIKDSAVHQDKYYLLTDNYLYEADMSEGFKFRLYTYTAGMDSLSVFENDFWYVGNGYLHEPFGGTTDMTIDYTSKLFIAPGYAYALELKKISLVCNGEFELIFYDDNDNVIATDSLDTDGERLIYDFNFDTSENEVNGVYFNITGEGEIFVYNIDVYNPEAENVIQQS